MKRIILKAVATVLTALILFSSLPANVSAEENIDKTIEDVLNETLGYVKSEYGISAEGKLFASEYSSAAGSTGRDWLAFAIGRAGIDEDYFSYLIMLEENIETRSDSEFRLATDWHRAALTALSLGGDPRILCEDADMIEIGILERENIGAQGINEFVWALITLDSIGYDFPSESEINREELIGSILGGLLENGSFTLNGTHSDTDLTAMALTVLSPYYNCEKVFEFTDANGKNQSMKIREIISLSLDWLSETQKEDGGFAAWGTENCETTAQVLTALCSLGIDIENDERFIKNGKNVFDGLMKYYINGGGFAHTVTDGEENSPSNTATAQSFYALTALYRNRHGMRRLFDIRPEQSEAVKSAIGDLDAMAAKEITEKSDAEAVINAYAAIPQNERCYIRNYDAVADAAERFGIELPVFDFNFESVPKAGRPINIFSGEEAESAFEFTENDKNALLDLPETLTTEHYFAVTRLYKKFSKSENANKYNDIKNILTAKKAAVDKAAKEVTEINALIDSLIFAAEEQDKDAISALVERVNALSDYDKTQIYGYEELLSAYAKIQTEERSFYINIAINIGAVLLIGLLLTRVARRYRKKKIKQSKENIDW